MIVSDARESSPDALPHHVELERTPSAAGNARDFVAEHTASLSRSTVDDIAVLVSELVTNAVRYGEGVIRLSVIVDLPLVVVQVHDDGAGRPPLEPHRPSDALPSGRGLLIVQAIASDWGVQPDTDGPGKTVWFELLVSATAD